MKIGPPEVEETNLNLIPIMNLFTALIPFLLLSAAFSHLAIIKVSVPVASSTGETDVAKEEDKVTLTLRITSEAFELSAASDTIGPEVLGQLAASIPRVLDSGQTTEATYASLTEHAFNVKSKYSASDTVVVVPQKAIPFHEVVDAVDAMRLTAREIDGARTRVELFPRVVLSSLVE